jgi:hypothetical protein
MVIPRNPLVTALAVMLPALLLCQCETTRTVKSTRSSFSFDQQMWGGQGDADSDKIDSKFAKRGYTIDEQGNIVADHPDLYKDQRPRGLGGEFQTKQARFKKMEAETKAFPTPEYLARQQFDGVSSARESGRTAREGNSQQSPDKAAGKLFAKKTDSSNALATYETGSYRESGEVYQTGSDRAASAVVDAPRAVGTPRSKGYQDNVAMSMDDVKKMLNPGAYARGTGIDD